MTSNPFRTKGFWIVAVVIWMVAFVLALIGAPLWVFYALAAVSGFFGTGMVFWLNGDLKWSELRWPWNRDLRGP